MLELQSLTKYYRNIPVVNDVSFTVMPGDITGYLGPNGSGKSTTVKMITGLLEPSTGRVLLDGRDIRSDLAGFRRRLGYVPEEPHLYSYLTGLEYLQLIGRLRMIPARSLNEKANDLLRLLMLHPYRHAAISSYSKGMKQRVLIAAALLHNPDLLVLDEPFSGFDIASAQLFRFLLRELAADGKMILFISHVLETVERVCEKVVIIYKGRLRAADSVERLKSLMQLPSLDDIFAQLSERQDFEKAAKDIMAAMKA